MTTPVVELTHAGTEARVRRKHFVSYTELQVTPRAVWDTLKSPIFKIHINYESHTLYMC
jgi:hypothetical protein